MAKPNYKLLICGDSCVTIQLGNEISPQVNALVRSLTNALTVRPVGGVCELVPTYCSVSVHYDPCIIDYATLNKKLMAYLKKIKSAQSETRRTIVIPVCYGGAFGPDLQDTAAYAGLTAQEVIRRHSGTDYLIYMLGFLPGFAYLGGLDPTIAVPRLETPRALIPAGSVGIGGEQTGIYPLASPGGWRLLGQTPVRPYDPERPEPFLYESGDYIRFSPIDEKEFDRIKTLVDNNQYQCRIEGAL